MEDNRINAAIAGLLHDAGKLAQRASDEPQKMPQDTIEENQPTHAGYSIRWIEQGLFKSNKQYRKIALPGAYHHRPQSYQGDQAKVVWAVALADKLSAGERSDRDREGKKDVPSQMLTIFDSIHSEETNAGEHYLPLDTLKLQRNSLFPVEPLSDQEVRSKYKNSKKRLEEEFSSLSDIPAVALEQMLSAWQRHTWSVPSAYYYSKPDISLYDHSRMTAALSACLIENTEEELINVHDAVMALWLQGGKVDDLRSEQRELLEKPALLLVGGDISGIQKFIYSIGSTNAAKSLRGRSFYLQLLSEAVLQYTLRELGLPGTNVIYAGGGHFYLLAPLSSEEYIDELRRKVTEKLINAHGIQLYLALESVEIPYSGFRKGVFPKYWGALHQKLSYRKYKRYTELENNYYQTLFVPQSHGGNKEATCNVCGREDQSCIKREDTEQTEYNICSLCSSFDTELGAVIPFTKAVSFTVTKPDELTGDKTAMAILRSFGVGVQLHQHSVEGIHERGGSRIILWELDDLNRNELPETSVPMIVRKHYTVTQVPSMDFNHLLSYSEGIHRLGVLRMDVDNLGQIFQKGFQQDGQSTATLSRLATLSMQLSLFFEGWMKRLIESKDFQDKDGKPLIYSVYSGGDDLFLIGPWHLMPVLAYQIVHEFSQYTGENSTFHLSGGMSFIRGKYPVHAAAADAGRLEAVAKDAFGNQKNAFAFLGGVWQWPHFITIMEKKEILTGLVGTENQKEGKLAPASLLQLLVDLDHKQLQVQKKHRGKKPIWGPWMWMGDYHLKRMQGRVKGDLKEKVKQIQVSLHEDPNYPYANLNDWAKAARWAQLELRETNP